MFEGPFFFSLFRTASLVLTLSHSQLARLRLVVALWIGVSVFKKVRDFCACSLLVIANRFPQREFVRLFPSFRRLTALRKQD